MVTNPYMFPWDTYIDNLTIETTPHSTTWSTKLRMTAPREQCGKVTCHEPEDPVELIARLLTCKPSEGGAHVYQVAKKVIYNDPATVVFWGDGTKTVVKAHDGDPYDERFGLLMAFLRKARDNKRYDQFEFLVKTAACMLGKPDEMDEFANALHGMAAQVRKEEKDG